MSRFQIPKICGTGFPIPSADGISKCMSSAEQLAVVHTLIWVALMPP